MSKCVRCDKELTPQEKIASYLCSDCYWEETDKPQREEEYDAYYHNEMQRIYDEEHGEEG